MPDYIQLLCDMLETNEPEVQDVTWDEFQLAAATHLFESLSEDDKWWGVH